MRESYSAIRVPSQDHGDQEVVDGADADADGHRHEEQPVEELAALLLGTAGAQDQRAAGGEGRDGGALGAQHRAGEQGGGAQIRGHSQGLGLAFTYGSCAVKRSDVEYVSLGEDGYFVDLVLVFPPDAHRTRSVRALEAMIRDFYHSRILS